MKILLVEDEPNVSSMIRKGLSESGYEVAAAYDGEMGFRMAVQSTYDLIILDLVMPGMNGLEVCRKLRENEIETPILMLTALGTTDDVVTGLDSGADDYLAKPFKFSELKARIRALSRRRFNRPALNVLRISDLEINFDSKSVVRAGKQVKLTAREFRLLEYLARNQGKVVSRGDILENVWDLNFDTGTNVVDVYVSYLRGKIDKGFDPKLIQTVVGMGYMLRPEA